MTSTQVEYWKLQENKRHNLVAEGQNKVSLDQNKIHLVSERIQANVSKYNAITARLTASETKRHDVATEKETKRHNVVSERLSASEVRVQQQNANTNAYNAQTNARNSQINTYNAITNRRDSQTRSYDAKTRNFAATAEATYKSVKSVSEFGTLMTKAGLSNTAKVYVFEELLLNPNVSKDSKTKILNYMRKVGLYDPTATAKPGTSKTTQVKSTTSPNAKKNIENKFKHH